MDTMKSRERSYENKIYISYIDAAHKRNNIHINISHDLVLV